MSKRDESVFVYIIASSRDGKPCAPCKCGISKKPESRLRELATASPNELILYCTITAPNRDIARQLEYAFHHVYSDRRSSGEWFNIRPIEVAKGLCANIEAALDALIDDDDLRQKSAHLCGLDDLRDDIARFEAACGPANQNIEGKQ